MSKITKAVIPCGGMGTRFLPITKAVPKEILPVIDVPVLGHIVNEMIDSGISDILIVLGNGKEAIKSYFTPAPQLEDALMQSGKSEFVEILKNITKNANISFTYQPKPLGTGDAVLRAESFVGKQAFALAWGDDLMYSENPVIGQLIAAHERTNGTILGVQTIHSDDIVMYGVADIGGDKGEGGVYKCRGIVEKPPIDALPSRLAALGRYVLTADVFDIIKNTPLGKGGELQLTDSLNTMCKDGNVYACDFVGRRYDMGSKFGAVQATIEYALRSKEYGELLRAYLKDLIK